MAGSTSTSYRTYNHVSVFDVELDQTIETRPMNHLFRVHGLAAPSDNDVLVTVGGEGIVKLWDLETSELIRRCE